jgi:hypothetical protein
MHKRLFIFLFLISLSALSTLAQELRPVISTERDSILIGDQINLKIQVSTNPETKIAWPRFEDFLVPKVEIISRSGIDSLWNENNLELQQSLIITSFDTGYYEIPGVEFTYQNPGEEAFLKSLTNKLDLYVYTVAVDTTQAIMPIKGPISSPYTWEEIAPWLLLGLIVIGMIIFLVYYFKRKSKQEPVFKAKSKPRIAPHIVALNGLEKLKEKKLWQEGKFKQYYTELIDIIRVYLDDQFGIDAMEMTSEEINQMVEREERIDKKIKQKLSEALSISDLVKFAKEKPIANINDVNLENLVEFVDKTREIRKEENLDKDLAIDKSETGITKTKEE